MFNELNAKNYLHELRRQQSIRYMERLSGGTPYVPSYHSIRYKYSKQPPKGQGFHFIQIYPGNWIRFFYIVLAEDYKFNSTLVPLDKLHTI